MHYVAIIALSMVSAFIFGDIDRRLDALEDQAPVGACTLPLNDNPNPTQE